MLITLLFIVVIILLLVFIEEYLGKYKLLAFIVLAFCLISFAGLRPVGFDRDSQNYESMFMHPDSFNSEISVEPSYRYISQIIYYIFPDIHLVFLFYALLGVSVKFWAIKRLSPILFLPVLIYVCNFFLLHECTQIRGGIASGLFLLSIIPLSEGKKLYAFLYILVAIFFHYSAISLLPLLFLDNSPFTTTKKIILALIVPLCFVLYAIGFDPLTSFNIPYITEKVEAYQKLSETKLDKESILNPFPLIKMAVFLYALYFSETIKPYVPTIYLLIKILGCSLIVYFAFASVKIISMRISELYGIIELVTYPCILYTLRPFSFGKSIVCIIAFIEIFFQLIQWKILDFDI